MIEINLLPEELKKKPSPFSAFSKMDMSGLDIKNIPVLKIVIGIGIAVIGIQLVLFSIGMIASSQLSSVSKKLNDMLPQKKVADALKAQVADINKRSAAIDELMLKRFSWAKKLNELSDCVTPGIWFSELYYDERPIPGKNNKSLPGALVVSGYASGTGEQGASLIGKFIKTMQDNKSFYSDFEKIDLVTTKSDKVDNQDVMSFKVACYFK